MSPYKIKNLITLSCYFKNADGTLFLDPTTVTLLIRKPDGTELTHTATPPADGAVVKRTSLGNFSGDVLLDMAGTWHYRWEGDGTAKAADAKQFVVERDVFYP